MEEVKLYIGHGNWSVIDADDYQRLSKHSWRLQPQKTPRSMGYVKRSTRINNKTVSFYLHREVMNAPADMHVDHINGNGLDNRKSNLRLCQRFLNDGNRSKSDNPKTSKYKGVWWDKRKKRWKANGGPKHLGTFYTEEDAAISYNKWAVEKYGEFALLNEVETTIQNTISHLKRALSTAMLAERERK